MLGLLAMPFGILAPFAIWTGARSWMRIRRSSGELHGATSALAGLVAGIVALAASLAGVIYWIVAS